LSAAQGASEGDAVFRRTIQGFNGYKTKLGYNMVLGNGTLRGRNFILAPTAPRAGVPQIPTNP
jgi:hypothetical protein